MLCENSTSRLSIVVDWLNPRNAAQMVAVLRIARLASCTPSTSREFCQLFLHRHLTRIALFGGHVAGFLLYEALPAGRRIESIAVDPEVQRCGIGTILLNHLKRPLVDSPSLTEIVAHVPERRLIAQQFFRENQFLWMQTISNGSGDGVYVMKYTKPTAVDQNSLESRRDAPASGSRRRRS